MNKGSSIYLRELRESDVNDNYINWFKDVKVTEFLDSRNLNRDSIIDYIRAGKSDGSYFMYAICDVKTNTHIGNVKIGPINYRHMTSDLVTFIGDTKFWGGGIATESIKQANRIAFEELNIRKLSGGINADNVGSIKCYTKAGWIVEGRLQNHYMLDGKFQDRVCVSCFNPYFDEGKENVIHKKDNI